MIPKKKIVKDHFDSFASFYGNIGEASPSTHIFTIRAKRVLELIDDLNGLNILSVGCGPAMMAGYILEEGGKYFGIDLSKHMLNEAKKRHKSETISLSQSDLIKLPFQHASFDLLLCLGALEYVDDLDLAVKELSRVVKDDGIIILSMQNQFSLYRLWDRYIYSGPLFNSLRNLGGRPIADKPLEKSVSLKNLRNTLFSHSFVELDYLDYNYNFWVKPFDRIFPKLSAATSERLEFLYRSGIGFLPADFLIKVQKVANIT